MSTSNCSLAIKAFSTSLFFANSVTFLIFSSLFLFYYFLSFAHSHLFFSSLSFSWMLNCSSLNLHSLFTGTLSTFSLFSQGIQDLLRAQYLLQEFTKSFTRKNERIIHVDDSCRVSSKLFLYIVIIFKYLLSQGLDSSLYSSSKVLSLLEHLTLALNERNFFIQSLC